MLEAVIQKDDFCICILNGFQGTRLLLSWPGGRRLSHISEAVMRARMNVLVFMDRNRKQGAEVAKAGKILSPS